MYPWRADYATAELWDAAIGAFIETGTRPTAVRGDVRGVPSLQGAVGTKPCRDLERELGAARIRALAYTGPTDSGSITAGIIQERFS